MITVPLWAIPTFITTLAVMFLTIGIFSSRFTSIKKFEAAIVRIEDRLDLKIGEVHKKIDNLINRLWPS